MEGDRTFIGEYRRAAEDSSWGKNCEEGRLCWFGLVEYFARLYGSASSMVVSASVT
jgi:hypothetical protein